MGTSLQVKRAATPVRQMDNSSFITASKTPFYCGWEWHLRGESRSCLLIYNLASRLVAEKELKDFWASAAKVAIHYDFSKDTALRALRRLRKLGFFEWQGVTDNGTNRYRVISHKEWAQKHPEQCAICELGPDSRVAEGMDEALPPLKSNQAAGPADKGQRKTKTPERSGTASGIAITPEATALALEMTYLSGGQINFQDKQRSRIEETLKEFTSKEITSAFKSWIDDQDLSDPKNVSFLSGQFVQIADGLCYTARKEKSEAAKTAIDRAAAVERIQAEAAKEREEAERKRVEEENLFDPLADMVA